MDCSRIVDHVIKYAAVMDSLSLRRCREIINKSLFEDVEMFHLICDDAEYRVIFLRSIEVKMAAIRLTGYQAASGAIA